MGEAKVPPDGGYGWVIVFANALSNFFVIPLMQSFGLIFKDTFATLGLSATQGSLIINVNSAFGMLIGLINGVLLKVYGYRKIAFVAAFLSTFGIVLTSISTTFMQFMITYGIITSSGMGMCMSAYSLAINSYFTKNRSRAVGYAMTITGLGPILLPQIIRFLMKIHTVQGVTLILGSLLAHTFISASLLQPVKWHMKTQIKEDEDNAEKGGEIDEISGDNRPGFERSISGVVEEMDEAETATVYGIESAMSGSIMSLHSAVANRRQSIISRKKSTVSCDRLKAQQNQKINNNTIYNPEMSRPIEQKSFLRRLWITFSNYFDLDLFKDPIYINIMLGMSLAVFAEINFSVLTAFILSDLGLDTDQIATFLSVLGVADIIFRFFAPFIGEYLNQPPRPMYALTLFLLIITRFSLFISGNYYVLLAVALGLGIAKGIRTVYMTLVIPSYVPIEKYASASGIQMMVNGLCILIGGPIIGYVRDFTGSYKMCVVAMNCVTFTTILMWTIEAIILRMKKNGKTTVESREMDEQTNELLR